MNDFTLKHPFITFLIVESVISSITTVAIGLIKDPDGTIEYEHGLYYMVRRAKNNVKKAIAETDS